MSASVPVLVQQPGSLRDPQEQQRGIGRSGDTYTAVSQGRYPDGTEWFIVNIGQLRDGKIWRVETYFAQAFEPPAWRSQWVERAGQ